MTRTNCLIAFCIFFGSLSAVRAEQDRPNILWIFAEDTSPWMGCYGDKVNASATPNIDALAAAGVRFANAFTPAPVCSPCRSAMMLGQNQIRFGAHEHRSSRGSAQIHLPRGMKTLPQIMKEAGYFTFNIGKRDYNFMFDDEDLYTSKGLKRATNSWQTLKQNQPFFGQLQTRGGKNNTSKLKASRKVDPSTVRVPPDYPQNQVYRETVAQHYDAIRVDDDLIGDIMQGLRESGLEKNTIVVYFSDHGAPKLLRHKQMLTEGGLHVPFIVTGPKRYVPATSVRDDLVNMLDLSATTLAWAGIDRPKWFEGRDLFAHDHQPRDFVAAAKDRMDSTLDRARTVRTKRFRYTRNYKLDRIFLQPQYRDRQVFTKNLRELYAQGKLSDKLKEIYFGERPAEEFYDVLKDPHQIDNLAKNPKFARQLQEHRDLLDAWLAKGDMGEGEEPIAELKLNAEEPKWGLGVNPEYEVFRTDNDGDGLSDTWEKINGRDPKDGRLLFEFDCGGWQTEGWQSSNVKDNLAGFLGYLDFHLPEGGGVLTRDGLKVSANPNDKALAIKLRSSKPLQLTATANGQAIAKPISLKAGGQFTTLQFALNVEWRGQIKSLALEFQGGKNAFIEIDSISVQR